ncbi:hypothetical protein DM860_017589 [Cuscuta australis]|uniref:Protein kinase domain-containing protein n=1 Tax=Cuscuta australis TaxID=267555 RepID=A0A328DDY7_9ASTE|nr:hypothetical protein DM860_017589 [Cuscuta australis]
MENIEARRFRSVKGRGLCPPSRSMPDLLPDWMLISVIAAYGRSGVLYEAMNRSTRHNRTLMDLPYDASQFEEISREVVILKELGHPNLVKCYDVVISEDTGRIFLILEPLCASFEGESITAESDLVNLAHQLILGLTYLHQNKIAHGDIKHSNVFFSHTRQTKLLYLGETLSNEPPPFLTEIGAMPDRFSWDIWSVGFCILKWSEGLNWSHRDVGFNQKHETSLGIDLNSSGIFPSSSNEGALVWNRELLGLIISCMQPDVRKRWTAEQLVHHPLFDQMQLKRERDIFDEEKELKGPVKKKSKLSTGDEHKVYGLESSKDPANRVPHIVPERCIEHCKLFLPNSEFGKDKLVQMWVAEDCIELRVAERMENVGYSYFDALVREKVIVPSKFDKVHREMKYKFNTCQVSDGLLNQGNYLRINACELGTIRREALHLTWQCKKIDQTFFDVLKNFKELHTLVVNEGCSDLITVLPHDIFLGLRFLRTLDLSRTHIEEIPGSIGKLESLQYLDFSGTPIKQLPDSTDRLHCLQTLNLKACFSLFTLPRGLGMLVNLRHLDLDIVSQLKSMPKGMGNLIELQTLRAFIVGKDDGCGIGELKHMNEITGSFCISGLENVSNAEEAKGAALSDKQYIDKLELRWRRCGFDKFQDTTEILESLQPHFGLKVLQLTFYGGLKLPSWISNPAYADLASITLYKCIKCHFLPSIGELPSLKLLHIFSMENLRNINTVFCGNHETKVVTAFPRLEELTLDSMPALEEWTGVEDGDFPRLRRISVRYCPKLRLLPSLMLMCSLEHLELRDCTQLVSVTQGLLPGTLESLIIRGCPGINRRCREDGGLDWLKFASLRNMWIDFEKIC